ncbi:hypothetical protein QE152_g6545 [Popillia japonica]|uniref:Uncharacterized protein n=1 Tax=Popillia japonica TaxID=7064 RepID=A0AAW1MHT4_POPJA
MSQCDNDGIATTKLRGDSGDSSSSNNGMPVILKRSGRGRRKQQILLQDLTTTVATQQSPITLAKLLDHISPVPMRNKVAAVRKKSRAVAEVFNSPEDNINLQNRNRQNKANKSVKSGENAKKKVNGKAITKAITKGNNKKNNLRNEKYLPLTPNPLHH